MGSDRRGSLDDTTLAGMDDEIGSGVGDLSGDHADLTSEVLDLTREAAGLTVVQVARMGISQLRERIPHWLAEHVLDRGELRAMVLARVQHAMARCSDEDLELTLENFRAAGEGLRFQPFDPAAQFINREFLREVPLHTVLFGPDDLERTLDRGPALIVANHLSYADAQHVDYLLFQYGHEEVAGRLVYAAPPTIYDNPYRRLAALALNTLPIPAGTDGDSGDPAAWSEPLRQARELQRAGFAPVLFAEGRRSRSGHMGPFLESVRAFMTMPDLRLVPLAITGTDEAFGVHQTQLMPAAITVSVGQPVAVDGTRPLAALERA